LDPENPVSDLWRRCAEWHNLLDEGCALGDRSGSVCGALRPGGLRVLRSKVGLWRVDDRGSMQPRWGCRTLRCYPRVSSFLATLGFTVVPRWGTSICPLRRARTSDVGSRGRERATSAHAGANERRRLRRARTSDVAGHFFPGSGSRSSSDLFQYRSRESGGGGPEDILRAAIISDSHGGLGCFSALNPSRLRAFV